MPRPRALLLLCLGLAACSEAPPPGAVLGVGAGRTWFEGRRSSLAGEAAVVAAGRDAALVAGPGLLAWVDAATLSPRALDGAPAGAPLAAAVDPAGRGAVLWAGTLARADERVRVVSTGSVGLGGVTRLAAAPGGDGLVLAGERVLLLGSSGIDELRFGGPALTVAAVSPGPLRLDQRAIWIAGGDRLRAVVPGATPEVLEVSDLDLGPVGALAEREGRLWVGAAGGLATRDASGAWRRYTSDRALDALAGRWALLDGALHWFEAGAEPALSPVLDASGAPLAAVRGLAVDASGAAWILRDGALERVVMEPALVLGALPAGGRLERPQVVEVWADPVSGLEAVSAELGGRALVLTAGEPGRFSLSLDPALLAPGPGALVVRARWAGGASSEESRPLFVGDPGPPVDFAGQILPWARDTCSCHFRSSPAPVPKFETQQEWREGDRELRIQQRVVFNIPPLMPPPEQSVRPSAEQRALLGRWIEQNRD